MSTMKLVAERAGVSVATVSRVINQNGYVAVDRRRKVIEAMHALNYQPSALARGLRRQETQSIGVLIPQLDQPFFSSLAFGIERALFAQGYRAFLCSSEENLEKESAYVDMLLRQRVDGVILVPTGESLVNVQRLLRARMPVVLVDRDLPGLELDRVVADNTKAARELAELIIELGHRVIGVIGSPRYSMSISCRLAGIRQALEAAGLSMEECLVVGDQAHQFETGFVAAQRLFRRRKRPSAILALNDVTAVGVMHAAWKAGFAVPTDLSVTGFDDIPLASYVLPELTTVRQPLYEMGEEAVNLLLDRIRDPSIAPREKVFSMTLVIRNSTSPLKN
jgi:LacI family transcriptional regulator